MNMCLIDEIILVQIIPCCIHFPKMLIHDERCEGTFHPRSWPRRPVLIILVRGVGRSDEQPPQAEQHQRDAQENADGGEVHVFIMGKCCNVVNAVGNREFRAFSGTPNITLDATATSRSRLKAADNAGLPTLLVPVVNDGPNTACAETPVNGRAGIKVHNPLLQFGFLSNRDDKLIYARLPATICHPCGMGRGKGGIVAWPTNLKNSPSSGEDRWLSNLKNSPTRGEEQWIISVCGS
jgi:hypothetical protein